MRYGITGLIATAYTLDKMDQRNGIKTGQTYMGKNRFLRWVGHYE